MSAALLALLAALAATSASLWTAQRQLRLKNVTEERAQWRGRIRELAVTLVAEGADAKERSKAAVCLQMSTNPFDRLDREIVALATSIAAADRPDADEVRLLALRLQLLLEHDWERAKLEAAWGAPLRSMLDRIARRPPRPAKPDYGRFVEWRRRHAVDPDLRLPPS